MRDSAAIVTLILCAALTMIMPAPAAEHFVSPDGTPGNAGTRDSPWDIASALDGTKKVAPGDTVSMIAGTYKRRPQDLFEVALVGTEAAPIHVRPFDRSSRVTIDGGLLVKDPAAHVWIHGLEIIVSENFTLPREIDEPGSSPQSYGRPWGGLNVSGGKGCKFIHLTIHHCAQGISCWTGAEGTEICGCLIYENGWKAPDRGHGHAIYTQNQTGTKTIRHCIMAAAFDGAYTIHAYGSSRAFVDNFVIEENVCIDRGPFLIGGGRPSHNIRAIGNILYKVPMRIGYSAPYNENCEVRNNTIIDAGLDIVGFKTVVKEGNRLPGTADKRPDKNEVTWLPSPYDSTRAHLAVFNVEKLPVVAVPGGAFLKPGERFRIMEATDIFGRAVVDGAYDGKDVSLPLGREFGAYVVLKYTESRR